MNHITSCFHRAIQAAVSQARAWEIATLVVEHVFRAPVPSALCNHYSGSIEGSATGHWPPWVAEQGTALPLRAVSALGMMRATTGLCGGGCRESVPVEVLTVWKVRGRIYFIAILLSSGDPDVIDVGRGGR
jgi:hypothetical protein